MKEDADRRIGSTVAGFVIGRRVARGPLATVYEGRQGESRAAIKIYEPAVASAAWASRIHREREAQMRIGHTCVARLVDAGVLPDGSAFIASDWIEGDSLESRLSMGPLPWTELRRVVAALGAGLGAIHAAGIVHRDLKPANVVVPSGGRPAAVILDFGHALVVGEERLTDEGLVLGSVAYMAPEQAAGEALDGRADLYALGVILYRGLCGTLPFENAAPAEILRMHRSEPVVPPSRRLSGVPRAAEDLCLWLLAKKPADRVPNAHVLSVTLRSVAEAPLTRGEAPIRKEKTA